MKPMNDMKNEKIADERLKYSSIVNHWKRNK
jgi:hypothetical protein